jgi:hypothetical protein
VGLAVGGLGVVAVSVGGVLALTAKNDYDSVEKDCPGNVCPPDAYNVRVNARTKADWATGTMIIGAAAFGTGLLLWLFAPDGSSSQSSRFSPVQLALGPGTVGLTVRLR